MKKLLIFISLVVVALSTQAQDNKVDSLIRELTYYQNTSIKLSEANEKLNAQINNIRHYIDSLKTYAASMEQLKRQIWNLQSYVKNIEKIASVGVILPGHFWANSPTFQVPSQKKCDAISDSKRPNDNLGRFVDDFTDEIKISSPTMIYSDNDIFIAPTKILKFINALGKEEYYLSLYTTGLSYTTDNSGIIILFDDGAKWNKNIKCDCIGINDDGYWQYTALIKITPSELNVFANKVIKKFRLYIHDEEYYGYSKKNFAIKFAEYCKAIKNAK
jgi:hypothetical protein|nr:MAG TPA: hypothetical protein [Caudoviricetes sp.]